MFTYRFRAPPTAGGELIVLNDINWGDTGLYKSGGIYNYPGNAQFVKNLVGFTTVETLVHSDLINVPNDVKVVILMMPGNAFATPEINGLKTFASQGGRILFIGENGSYYAYGIPTEDAFLAGMGALMTNNGNVVAGIAKIDLTLHSVSALTRQAPNRSAMPVQKPNALPGTAGWTGTGPPPRP